MRLFPLLVSFILAYAAAAIGSFFTVDAVDTWYAALAKPALSPPNWLFGPVWTVLYALMAIAAWRVYERRHENPLAWKALAVYLAHLALNAFWSVAFFGLENPALALFVVVLLLFAIVLIAFLFYRIDRLAGLLFLPYILWVSFATYLNAAIVALN